MRQRQRKTSAEIYALIEKSTYSPPIGPLLLRFSYDDDIRAPHKCPLSCQQPCLPASVAAYDYRRPWHDCRPTTHSSSIARYPLRFGLVWRRASFWRSRASADERRATCDVVR